MLPRKLPIVARQLATRTRWARLQSVFPRTVDRELHALVACLCVLFEDLRIEINGQIEEDLKRLDECGTTYRNLYFLRRSIATLHEFAEILRDLDRLPSFQLIRLRFDVGSEIQWKRATTYFRKYSSYIARLRNNVGGHFGKQAGEGVIKALHPDATGALEVLLNEKGGRARLLFASELAATGLLDHVAGSDPAAKIRRLFKHALVAYRFAITAVDCVSVTYLWDRFGRS